MAVGVDLMLSVKQHINCEDEYAKYQESSDEERVENVPTRVVKRSSRSYACHEIVDGVEIRLKTTIRKTTTQRTSDTIARAKRWPDEDDEEFMVAVSICPCKAEESLS
jgi:hypothetical protein